MHYTTLSLQSTLFSTNMQLCPLDVMSFLKCIYQTTSLHLSRSWFTSGLLMVLKVKYCFERVTLGTHAQWELLYLLCLSVYLSVCLSVCYQSSVSIVPFSVQLMVCMALWYAFLGFMFVYLKKKKLLTYVYIVPCNAQLIVHMAFL